MRTVTSPSMGCCVVATVSAGLLGSTTWGTVAAAVESITPVVVAGFVGLVVGVLLRVVLAAVIVGSGVAVVGAVAVAVLAAVSVALGLVGLMTVLPSVGLTAFGSGGVGVVEVVATAGLVKPKLVGASVGVELG